MEEHGALHAPLMKIIIQPTCELHNAAINDTVIPVRTWRGTTSGGVEIEAYLLAVAPVSQADTSMLKKEFPPYLLQSLAVKRIDEWPKRPRRRRVT
jgi:hypothetical protein